MCETAVQLLRSCSSHDGTVKPHPRCAEARPSTTSAAVRSSLRSLTALPTFSGAALSMLQSEAHSAP